MMPSSIITVLVFSLLVLAGPTFASWPHFITFRSQDLYPESVAYDPKGQHFIVGSLRHATLLTVSDAGVSDTLIFDASLPSSSYFLGISLDPHRNRILAVVRNHRSRSRSFLAAYDLQSRQRLFLAPLLDDREDPSNSNNKTVAGANDVAVDTSGSAFVTNSAGNFIWKVNVDGEASIFSRSRLFSAYPVDHDAFYSFCGLNGIVYLSKGYFLVLQSNTGRLFKVDAETGKATSVILNRDLPGADGIAVRKDGVVVVVSQARAYFIKSQDSWSEGVVFDETVLDSQKEASSVAVGGKERVYVLYGYVNEGMMENSKREEFSLVEIESEKERNEQDSVWIFVLIGLGLAYFLFWRFQMRQLVANMNKKTA